VIVVAVAVRLTIEAPTGSVFAAFAATMLGGPAIYLAGLVLFKRSVSRGKTGPPLAGICVLALLTATAPFVSRLALAFEATVVLAALAIAGARSGEEEAEGR
jgi:low temperature requirement protein LtrA